MDYQKAFDSVEVPMVLEAIESLGVKQIYINILKYIYQNTYAFIHFIKTRKFLNRQGNCISPKLFSACIENILRKLNWENKGIKIDSETFTHLRFADDIVLVSHDLKELQTVLEELNREIKAVGLEMNIKKTQVMFNEQIDREPEVKIDQIPLKIVSFYIYLGQLITTLPNKEKKIKRRISSGWQAFGRAISIFERKMPISLKFRV